jgi:hypothetical protein
VVEEDDVVMAPLTTPPLLLLLSPFWDEDREYATPFPESYASGGLRGRFLLTVVLVMAVADKVAVVCTSIGKLSSPEEDDVLFI